MATTSNIRLHWRQDGDSHAAQIPLHALPFPAAILDHHGIVVAANPDWEATHPMALPGASGIQWSESLHGSAADLHAALVSGLRNLLDGKESRFVQEFGPADQRRRITITRFVGGAYVFYENLACEPDTPVADRAQAQKMEAVGRLVGGVAHDFANLITMIAGYTDILLNRLSDRDPIRQDIDEIRKAANRGARLTSQLLGFTRGNAVQPRPVDLNVVVADLQRMLRPIIGEYVQLHADLGPNLYKVVADPGQMEQVIMNLILNARDAMPGGGRIRLETANGELDEHVAREHGIRPGPCVTLSITDHGHGIDPEQLAHIFEPFYTTKEKGKGTGLGLSTVQQIVQESGGAIWVHTAPGEGATFTVCLPRAAQSPDSQEAQNATRAVVGAGTETVLLVEDEDGVRRLLTHILTKRGYRILEAASGEEALRQFERHSAEIQLVLTDMVMPKMSGRELAEQIRLLSPGMRVVFMSGYTDDVLFRTGALCPGMSFLQKPLRPDVLAAKLREALDAR